MKIKTFNKGILFGVPLKILLIMKLILVLLTVFLVQAHADVLAQNVSLNEKNTSLEKVLDKVRTQTGYDFLVLDYDLLREADKVTINIKNTPLKKVLNEILLPRNLSYTVKDNSIVIKQGNRRKKSRIEEIFIEEQDTIRGRVVDSLGNPLQRVTISLQGTSIASISSEDGSFVLPSSDVRGSIRVAHMGYQTQEVAFDLSSKEPVIIRMVSQDNTLDHVQVIGYGETTKRFNTGSVVEISAKEIESQPVTNVMSALSGRVPGAYVQTTNGLPGGNINIQIRGTGSIQAGTNPLYIIDGVPFDGASINQGTILASSNIVGAISPLNILNPNDIESISVLKDADATAIYGSRGTNGVVLINTKKGSKGDTRINLSLNQGFNKIANHPSLLDLDQYLELRHEAFKNDGRTPSGDPTALEYAPDLTIWNQNESVNWSEYIFGKTANVTNTQLSVSGGAKGTTFNLSGNYRREGTVIIGDNRYSRGGIQSVISHKSPNGRFRVNFSSIYNLDNSHLSNPANSATSMFLLPPNYSLYNHDGSYNWQTGHNIDAQLLSNSSSESNNFIGNLVLAYDLPMGVELKVSSGYNRRELNQRQRFPTESLYPGGINYTLFGNNSSNSYTLEPQATYSINFDNSSLKFLAGGTYQYQITNRMTLRSSGYTNEDLMEDLGAAGTINLRTNLTSEYKYISAFGRATYNLMDKYIVNGIVRRDGSSRFGSSNQFGNFYSIGTAWLFTSEDWFKINENIISFGKLRASYGVTGNDQIADYEYLSTYRTRGSNVYQGVSVLSPSRIFNSQFHWETTRKVELGIELGLINNKIFLTGNYYKHQSDNQLVNYPLPKITGFSSYQANMPAEVRNSGWEFDLNARVVESNDFEWDVNGNITFPKNKLVSFENIEQSSYSNTHKVGYDITRVYGYSFVKVDPETGIALFADENNEISDNPFRFHTLGKVTPEFYGGIGNSFSYKKVQLEFFAQFSKHSSFGNLLGNQFGSQLFNSYKFLTERWSKEGDNASIPKVSSIPRTDLSFYGQSNGNFFSLGYIRLKNISLAYELPYSFIDRVGMKSLRLIATAQNVFTVWDNSKPVLDPESGGNSGALAIPPAKSFLFGINLTL